MKPLVSVVIPTYNCEYYIKEAIESILNQSYNNIEIIVVDDGSSDDTKSVLDPLIKSDVIKYIYQSNKGVSSARNIGISEAKGDYIAFLDADDLLLPESIEKRVSAFQTFTNAQMVFSDYYMVKNYNEQFPLISLSKNKSDLFAIGEAKVDSNVLLSSFSFFEIYRHNPDFIWTGAVMVKKEVFSCTGYFNESKKVSEDIEMWNKIVSNYYVIYLDKPLSKYMSFRSSLDKYEVHYTDNINKYKHDLSYFSYSAKDSLILKNKISNSYVALAYKVNISKSDFKSARRNLVNAIIHNPNNKMAYKYLLLCMMPSNVYTYIRRLKKRIYS